MENFSDILNCNKFIRTSRLKKMNGRIGKQLQNSLIISVSKSIELRPR